MRNRWENCFSFLFFQPPFFTPFFRMLCVAEKSFDLKGQKGEQSSPNLLPPLKKPERFFLWGVKVLTFKSKPRGVKNPPPSKTIHIYIYVIYIYELKKVSSPPKRNLFSEVSGGSSVKDIQKKETPLKKGFLCFLEGLSNRTTLHSTTLWPCQFRVFF